MSRNSLKNRVDAILVVYKKSIAFALCGLMIMLISSCKTYKDSLSVASVNHHYNVLPYK